jgi:hypothetical protein
MLKPIVLVIAEVDRRGRYDGSVDGVTVVSNVREPFFSAARKLIAQGLDPCSPYVMRRTTDGPNAMVSTLGVAARLTVSESDAHGPRIVPYVPHDRLAFVRGSAAHALKSVRGRVGRPAPPMHQNEEA